MEHITIISNQQAIEMALSSIITLDGNLYDRVGRYKTDVAAIDKKNDKWDRVIQAGEIFFLLTRRISS